MPLVSIDLENLKFENIAHSFAVQQTVFHFILRST